MIQRINPASPRLTGDWRFGVVLNSAAWTTKGDARCKCEPSSPPGSLTPAWKEARQLSMLMQPPSLRLVVLPPRLPQDEE
jgi:hypothetical protein